MIRGVLSFAAAVALLALPALAEEVVIDESVFLKTQGDGQYLARDFILGLQVRNADGQIIGDIEDLILNADNQIEGVVMGTGGFAGFGEKRVGVTLSALQIENKDGKVTIVLPQATKEVLDALKPFERAKPPKSLLDRAIDKAKELTEKGAVTAKDAYEKAKEDAEPTLEKAKEAAKEAYDDVKEKAAPVLEKAKEAAREAYDKAREAIENKPPDAATESTPLETESSTPTPNSSTPAASGADTTAPPPEVTAPTASEVDASAPAREEPASQP